MERNVKTALVGLGGWGKNLFRVLQERKVLKWVCDINATDFFQEKQKNSPEILFTRNLEDILEDPEVEAVFLATPAVTHYELGKKVLSRGKDLFVEKPMAMSVREGEELLSLARQNKQILMVGHILHFHPAIQELRERLKAGFLGRLRYIYSHRVNMGKLRTDENILWSFAPHDISLILSLAQQEPVDVRAFGRSYLNPPIYDTALTILDFPGGLQAFTFATWLYPFKERRVVIVGSEGMVVFDETKNGTLYYYPHKVEWWNGKTPVAHREHPVLIPVEEKEPLKEEVEHFLSCVIHRKTPLTDGEEGLRVLKVLEKAQACLDHEEKVRFFPVKAPHPGVFIHESSYVDEDVTIGKGTRIWHFSHILKGSKIGENCVIGQNVMIGPDVTIGNRCKIQNNVSVYKGVTVEDDVFLGPSCVFTNVHTPRAFIERKNEFLPTFVKKGATIGANATILCGVTIGQYAFVGAGAVVLEDVPDYGLVVGVPARLKGWVCECGEPLKRFIHEVTCSRCGKKYRKEEDKIVPQLEAVPSQKS